MYFNNKLLRLRLHVRLTEARGESKRKLLAVAVVDIAHRKLVVKKRRLQLKLLELQLLVLQQLLLLELSRHQLG